MSGTPRRRILIPFLGTSVGGSHVSAITLAEALRAAGHDPVIGLHETGDVLAEWLTARGMPFIALPRVEMPAEARSIARQVPMLVRTVPPLRRYLRQGRFDLVHSQDLRMHRLWTVPARTAGIAHVWHQRTPTRSRRAVGFARFATEIVAVSAFCREALPDAMRARASVVLDPVAETALPDGDAIRARLLALSGATPDRPVIGFAANLAPRKRADVFVAAAERLLAGDGPRPVFAILGEEREPDAAALRARIADAGLAGDVALIGPQRPLEPWLAAFDILAAPARREAFGRVLVEAMLAGTPVVAADEGGHREILRHGETGLLVPPDDPDALARAMRGLLQDPERSAALARAGRADARARFSVDAHLREMEAVFDRACRARRL